MRRIFVGLLLLSTATGCGKSKEDRPGSVEPAAEATVKPPTGNEIKAPETTSEDLAALDKIAASIDGEDAESLAERGMLYLMAGEDMKLGAAAYERAIDDLKRSLELDPSKAGNHSNLAMAYVRLNQPKLAIGPLSKAIELSPTDAGFLAMRASAHARGGDDESAVKDLTAALAIAPNDKVLFNRANAYVRLGQKDKATKDFQTVADTTQDPGVKQNALTNLEALRSE